MKRQVLIDKLLSVLTKERIKMAELKFEIVEHLITMSENPKGWTKELNRVSWNDAEPKYDIRQWSPDHLKMGKGITLSNEEFGVLLKELGNK